MTNDSRLDKIRALLAKAENSASTPAESEAYTAKAAELISKWGMEDAIAEAKQEDRPRVNEKIIKLDGSYLMEKSILVFRVARGLGGDSVRVRRAGEMSCHIFGSDTDILRIELLFTSLLVQAGQGLAVAQPWNPNENIKTYRRSWLSGFAAAIGNRLDALRQKDTVEAGAGTDLVLLDRTKLVEQRVSVFYPTLRFAKRRLAGSGKAAGYGAGSRASLSTGEGQVRHAGPAELTR